MFKRAMVYASFIAAMAVASANAQPPPNAVGIIQTSQQQVRIPGTGYDFELGSFRFPVDGGYVEKSALDGDYSADRLVTALVTWITNNIDIAADYHNPRIVPKSSATMTNLLYRSLLEERTKDADVPEDQAQSDSMSQVFSLYSVATKTIYLLPEWTGRTPAELSMLVHELVHHLQNVGHLTYGCPQERERLAYEAQEKWLNLFGRSLSSEFGLTEFTLFMITGCTD